MNHDQTPGPHNGRHRTPHQWFANTGHANAFAVTRRFIPTKKVLFGGLSVLVCLIVIGLLYMGQQGPKRGKKVWMQYSEKYQTEDGTTFPRTNNKLFAEERLRNLGLMNGNPTCLVLTRNRPKADYLVVIQVTRTDGDIFGEAQLSIVNARGDVVAAETFYQQKDSREDIAQQPITATWRTLCSSRTPDPK